MSLQNFKILIEILNSCEKKTFNKENNSIILQSKENQSTEAEFKNKLNIEVDTFEDSIHLDISSFDYKLYWDEEHINSKLQKDDSFLLDFAILNFLGQDNNLYFESEQELTYKNLILDNCNFFFKNVKYYLKFLIFLKSKEHKEDNYFHFVDYFGWDNRIIVFTSPKKEGKLTITFPQNIPLFDFKTNYKDRFNRFFDSFKEENKHLPKFIKTELFNHIFSISQENRLLTLVEKLDTILEISEQNFDIYLNELSLENLKRDYLEYKDKYFTQLRDILSKISNQIIGLPISISATVVATSTLKDNITTTLLVIVAFVAYTIFAVFILRLQKEEIADIKLRFNSDFDKLNESPFFTKYPKEKVPFETVKSQVLQRINVLNYTILAYFILLSLTNSLMLIKMLLQIAIPLLLFALLILIFMIIIALIFWVKFKTQ